MRQVLLERSLLLFAREVRMSANRKSAQLTGCVGNSTRPSVRQKKVLEGPLRAWVGSNIMAAVAPYMNGGTRMAADVADAPPLAQRAALDDRHVALKHTSACARPHRFLQPAK